MLEPRSALAMLMEDANAVRGAAQRAHHAFANPLDGRVNLDGGDPQVANFGVVKGTRELPQCVVTARADIVEDALDHRVRPEIRTEGLVDGGPHAGGKRARIERHQPAPDQKRFPRRRRIGKASYHPGASHGSGSIANLVGQPSTWTIPPRSAMTSVPSGRIDGADQISLRASKSQICSPRALSMAYRCS